MPYLSTAQSWLENSTLLLSARPTTARITTKYSIQRNTNKKPSSSRVPPTQPSSASTASPANPPAQHHREPPKATLILKTFDPVSGVCLKYRTDKAAEVGRLVAALGSCGRVMAALPEKRAEDGGGGGGGGVDGGDEIAGGEGGAGLREGVPVGISQQQGKDKGEGKGKGGAGAGGGGGGKKRKGKR